MSAPGKERGAPPSPAARGGVVAGNKVPRYARDGGGGRRTGAPPSRRRTPSHPSAPTREGSGKGPRQGAPCIRVEGLTHHYDEISPALNGVDLTIRDNAYLAIIGQNGSGKTTLVKHFNGLLKPGAGHVWVEGTDTRATSVGELARRVGYVFQNPDHMIFGATVREEVSFGPRNLGLGTDEVRGRTEEALAAFDLTAHAETPPAVLGYGLRRKVSLAAVFAMRPHILILDEPTAGLDARSTADLMARVDGMHREGHTIILVTHDMRLATRHCHEVLVMHEGRVLAHGPTREVFCRAEDLALAQLAPPQVAQLARRLEPRGMPCDVLTADEFVEAYATLGTAALRKAPPGGRQ